MRLTEERTYNFLERGLSQVSQVSKWHHTYECPHPPAVKILATPHVWTKLMIERLNGDYSDDCNTTGLCGVHRFERVPYRSEHRIVVGRTARLLSLQLHRLPRLSAASDGQNHYAALYTVFCKICTALHVCHNFHIVQLFCYSYCMYVICCAPWWHLTVSALCSVVTLIFDLLFSNLLHHVASHACDKSHIFLPGFLKLSVSELSPFTNRWRMVTRTDRQDSIVIWLHRAT